MIGTSLLFSGSIAGLLTPFDSVAPTAGYSLRNLGLSYSGAVVRVRKDITGNPEQDFTASQITNGTLSNFLETLGTDAHSQSVSTQFEDLSDVSLICDCNSGGTDELDAFDALYENGFVSKWYDQFGSNDATQTSASSQPKIWDASTGLVTENGKPAFDFDGTDYLDNISLVIPQPSTYFIVYRYDNVTDFDKTDIIDGIVSRNLIDITTGGFHRIFGGTNFISSLPATTLHELSYNLFNSISSQKAINGGVIQTGDAGTDQLEGLLIGARNGLGAKFDGTIQELIIYNSDQSANRTEIEDNINDYYDIY